MSAVHERHTVQRGTSESHGAADAAIDALRRFWRGRRVILMFSRTGSRAGALIGQVESCGATVSAVVSGGGPTPDVPHAWARDTATSISDFDTWLRSEPAALADWLDGIDPDRSCLLLTSMFMEVPRLFGRAVHGWRRPRHAAWEDKTRIEELWREAGVLSPPAVVLPITSPSLAAEVARLDRGRGVVLAMDTTSGYHAGAAGIRWVRHSHELASVLESLAGATKRVRIAPFVDGVPCSVLGLVLDGGVAVFDPIEIVTLRNVDTGELVFCGSSTRWRPNPRASEAMRRIARRAGTRLAERIGYRGMFSVDGVLTGEGFLATELNPRHASGWGLREAWPRFPSYLLHRATVERVPGVVDLSYVDFENGIRRVIRRHPSHAITVPLPAREGGEEEVETLWCDDGSKHGLKRCTVRYRRTGTAAWVLGIEPLCDDRTTGPAVAALATALGASGLVSFRETAVRSTLGGVPR